MVLRRHRILRSGQNKRLLLLGRSEEKVAGATVGIRLITCGGAVGFDLCGRGCYLQPAITRRSR